MKERKLGKEARAILLTGLAMDVSQIKNKVGLSIENRN